MRLPSLRLPIRRLAWVRLLVTVVALTLVAPGFTPPSSARAQDRPLQSDGTPFGRVKNGADNESVWDQNRMQDIMAPVCRTIKIGRGAGAALAGVLMLFAFFKGAMGHGGQWKRGLIFGLLVFILSMPGDLFNTLSLGYLKVDGACWGAFNDNGASGGSGGATRYY